MVGAKEYGELRVKPDKFIIHINKQHALGTQIETLLHEWAHALVWHPNERVVHRTEWARMYVKLLRWVQGEGEWDVCLDNIPRPLETPGQVE
jgi:predicted SprT family Zn-dependent metalloprotease